MLKIRVLNGSEYLECEKILRSLPEWFGIGSAIINYVNDIKNMVTYVAVLDEKIIGFITIKSHNNYSSEIQVMAVNREYHNQRVGHKLIKTIENYLKEKSVYFLQVKTLSDSSSDVNYAKTRKFYLANGFLPLEEMKDLWDSTNPCLIMIKKL